MDSECSEYDTFLGTPPELVNAAWQASENGITEKSKVKYDVHSIKSSWIGAN